MGSAAVAEVTRRSTAANRSSTPETGQPGIGPQTCNKGGVAKTLPPGEGKAAEIGQLAPAVP